MFKLYQAAIRSVFTEDTSKNMREGPLSLLMGSKYVTSSSGIIKLVSYIKEHDYLNLTEESKIGYTASYLNTPNSLAIIQFIGMNITANDDHWTQVPLSNFNSRVPLIRLDFPDKKTPSKENINPDEWANMLLVILSPNIEVYTSTLFLGEDIMAYIKSKALQPSKFYEKDNHMEVYNQLTNYGIGLYHTAGCKIKFENYLNYDFFDELNINISKLADDTYQIGDWDKNMLIYKDNGSQIVDNQDVIEQLINGHTYKPSLLIIKINVNIEHPDESESYKDNQYYLVPEFIFKKFK